MPSPPRLPGWDRRRVDLGGAAPHPRSPDASAPPRRRGLGRSRREARTGSRSAGTPTRHSCGLSLGGLVHALPSPPDRRAPYDTSDTRGRRPSAPWDATSVYWGRASRRRAERRCTRSTRQGRGSWEPASDGERRPWAFAARPHGLGASKRRRTSAARRARRGSPAGRTADAEDRRRRRRVPQLEHRTEP